MWRSRQVRSLVQCSTYSVSRFSDIGSDVGSRTTKGFIVKLIPILSCRPVHIMEGNWSPQDGEIAYLLVPSAFRAENMILLVRVRYIPDYAGPRKEGAEDMHYDLLHLGRPAFHKGSLLVPQVDPPRTETSSMPGGVLIPRGQHTDALVQSLAYVSRCLEEEKLKVKTLMQAIGGQKASCG